MTEEEKKVLEEFLTNIKDLDELAKWETQFSVFDVLKISKNEIRHSNVLAWLLDSKENHNLGSSVLYNLLAKVVANNPTKYNSLELLLLDLDSFVVEREKANIDLLLTSKEAKTVIVIENKVMSHEHGTSGGISQLEKYKRFINSNYVDCDYSHRIFLYLTPNAEDASDTETWDTITYDDIYESIDYAIKTHDVTNNIKIFIEDYLSILKRDIMEDQELKQVCSKIYLKHRKALELIYNNCDIGNGAILNGVRDALKELSAEGAIVYNPDVDDLHFYTQELDEYLGRLAKNNSSWKTDRCYQYWFETYNQNLYLRLELGGGGHGVDKFGVDDNLDRKLDQIIKNNKTNDCRKPYKYKRVITIVEKIKDEYNITEECKKISLSMVTKILEKQKEFLNKIYKDNI